VFFSSYVKPVQSAGIKLMREVPLDPFSPPPLQTLATIPENPTPIAVHGSLLLGLALPVARAAIGFSDIGPHFHLRKAEHDVIAVIALVRHHFLHSVGMHFILAFRRLF